MEAALEGGHISWPISSAHTKRGARFRSQNWTSESTVPYQIQSQLPDGENRRFRLAMATQEWVRPDKSKRANSNGTKGTEKECTLRGSTKRTFRGSSEAPTL